LDYYSNINNNKPIPKFLGRFSIKTLAVFFGADLVVNGAVGGFLTLTFLDFGGYKEIICKLNIDNL